MTTYPQEVDVDTSTGRIRLCFVDPEPLFFALPAGSIGMRFQVRAARVSLDRRGGTRYGIHNVACTTDARLVRNEIIAIDASTLQVTFIVEAEAGTGVLLNITPRLGFNRALPDHASARWQTWFEAVPRVDAHAERQYYYAWWIMRVGLISPRYYMTREGMELLG